MSQSRKSGNTLELRYDKKFDFFVLHEKGITYDVPAALVDNLKKFYSDYPSIGDWYSSLDTEKQKMVTRRDMLNDIFPINDAGFMVQ